jgi:hypothetical protein
VFQLDLDQAGTEVQCPRCSRLNDVPRRSELGQIGADGVYRLDEPAPVAQTNVAADLAYVYQKGARDAEGNEIDLRLAPHEFEVIGHGKEIPLTPDGVEPKHGPRYDPETGELITPLEVRQFADESLDPSEIPMAKPVLNYAAPAQGMPRSALGRFVSLLSPVNIIVMAGVFVLHVLLWPLLLVVFAGIMIVIVSVPFLAGAILAHYGNVIEDIGPRELDELPRPMRDLGWHEDLWSPFVNVLGSLLLCYGPTVLLAVIARGAESVGWGALAIILGAIGTFLFPAVVLTLQCGSTALNLRPDRLFTVIAVCGRDYKWAVFAWIVAGVLYLWSWGGSTLAAATAMQGNNFPIWLASPIVTLPVLIIAIFAMHYFAVSVGMLYRVHNVQFPWILQRHVPIHRNPAPGLPPTRRPHSSPLSARERARVRGNWERR